MNDLLNQAMQAVEKGEADVQLIAKLGAELEQTYLQNRRLYRENRHLRDSRQNIKKRMNYFVRYFKAHRDALLEDRND